MLQLFQQCSKCSGMRRGHQVQHADTQHTLCLIKFYAVFHKQCTFLLNVNEIYVVTHLNYSDIGKRHDIFPEN